MNGESRRVMTSSDTGNSERGTVQSRQRPGQSNERNSSDSNGRSNETKSTSYGEGKFINHVNS